MSKKATLSHNLAERFPEIAAEWAHDLNGGLRPRDILPGSSKAVYWRCKKWKKVWTQSPYSRTRSNGRCRFCYSLAGISPRAARQWHPRNNSGKTPWDVLAGSSKKAWFKHPPCGTVRAVQIAWKAKNPDSCGPCSGKAAYEKNCLATTHPAIARMWHPKNQLTPKDVTSESHKVVLWKCDLFPAHEYSSKVRDKVKSGRCKLCNTPTSHLELRVFSELATIFDDIQNRPRIHGMECDIHIPRLKLAIEVDGAYWHKNSQGRDLRKNRTLARHGIRILRLRERPLKLLSKNDIWFTHGKEAESIKALSRSLLRLRSLNSEAHTAIERLLKARDFRGERLYRRLLTQISKPPPGRSLRDRWPELCREWDSFANAPLRPEFVYERANISASWVCLKNPNHRWRALVSNRTAKSATGCPFCATSGNKKVDATQSFAARYPTLIADWDIKRNRIAPTEVLPKSNKSVWWRCSFDVLPRNQAGLNCALGC